MKKIKLNSKKYPNKYALVDDEDFDYLNQWKWRAAKDKTTFYALRNIIEIKNNKKCCSVIFMHREIMHCPKNKQIDHINHNGLDNQKKNLRICNQQQNMMNKRSHKNSSSKYKGISWSSRDKIWQVHIKNKDKKYTLGSYKNEKLAAHIYDYKANELFGEYAFLNFPNDILTKKEFKKFILLDKDENCVNIMKERLA